MDTELRLRVLGKRETIVKGLQQGFKDLGVDIPSPDPDDFSSKRKFEAWSYRHRAALRDLQLAHEISAYLEKRSWKFALKFEKHTD